MADPRQRRERLLALLPRIYTAQPRDSAVGAVVDALAAALARVDDSLTRVQYDRWVGLASPLREGDDISALEALGRLLQVNRLPPRLAHAGYDPDGPTRLSVRFDAHAPLADALHDLIGDAWRQPDENGRPGDPAALLAEQFPGVRFALDDAARLQADADTPAALARFRALLDPEPGEIFRQRLRVTAQVRTGGLTTPRALLALALADLGAEPCPRLERRQDSTLARGMAPGTRKRCAACAGDGPCPNTPAAVVEAWLTEHPVEARRHTEPAPRLRRVFTLDNPSLLPDRPVWRLTVSDQPAAYPAVRSLESGEITLFAGTLKPGDTLVVQPALSPTERAGFDGYDSPGHHAWSASHPAGRAIVIDADGAERDVSDAVFYLWGTRFDAPEATLDGGMRCGVLDQRVVTPQLRPGSNAWMLLTFAKPDAEFADAGSTVHTSRFAGPQDADGTRFALLDGSLARSDAKFATLLFEAISKTDTASTTEGSTANAARLRLDLEWVARPPATARLRIPKNEWVAAAATRGVLALVRSDVTGASAAGVRIQVDFPEPVRREYVVSGEGLSLHTGQRWREDAAPAERGPHIGLKLTLRDSTAPQEGHLSTGLVFDTTRLDWSHAG